MVTITAGVRFEWYQVDCILPTGTAIYAGLLLPIIVITIFDWVMFIVILASQCKKRTSDKNSSIKFIKRQVVIICGVTIVSPMVILSSGFVRGNSLTGMTETTIALSFIFYAGFSLRGVLLFFFHGVRNPSARKQWKMWFTKIRTLCTNKK